MCGLFGAIGRGADPQIIRTLAVLNITRGSQSTGFFTGSGGYFKDAESSHAFLRRKDVSDWIRESCEKEWVIGGHTRAASRGSVCTKNAHPFAYTPPEDPDQVVIGSHNGTIMNAPTKFDVDSMWAINDLAMHRPNQYQAALGDKEGWYVLTWADTRARSFYILNWRGELALAEHEGCVYYSSDKDHLATALGKPMKLALNTGDVWRFTDGKPPKRLKPFQGAVQLVTSYWRGRQSRGGNTGYSHNEFTGKVKRKTANGPWHSEIWQTRGSNEWVESFNQKEIDAAIQKYCDTSFTLKQSDYEKANEDFYLLDWLFHKEDAAIVKYTATRPTQAVVIAGRGDGYYDDDTVIDGLPGVGGPRHLGFLSERTLGGVLADVGKLTGMAKKWISGGEWYVQYRRDHNTLSWTTAILQEKISKHYNLRDIDTNTIYGLPAWLLNEEQKAQDEYAIQTARERQAEKDKAAAKTPSEAKKELDEAVAKQKLAEDQAEIQQDAALRDLLAGVDDFDALPPHEQATVLAAIEQRGLADNFYNGD